MDIDLSMFQQAFFEEAGELLADFEACLLRLEENPTDRELLNTIFRCAHSLKGGSATFGLPEMAQFTHGLETLLDRLREGKIKVTPVLCELLLQCLDQLRILLDFAKGAAVSVPDSKVLSARVMAACESELTNAFTKPETGASATVDADEGAFGFFNLPVRYRLIFVPGADVPRSGCDPLLYLRNLRELAEITSIVCDVSRLPDLRHLDPLTCYLGWEIELVTDESPEAILAIFDFIADESEIDLSAIPAEQAEANEPVIESAPSPVGVAAQGSKVESPSLRVSSEKVDGLINLVGELLISQSMLIEATRDFEMSRLPALLEAVMLMARASNELQARVMGIRLVPVKQAFSRFPRLVRDLSSTCHKKIELKTSGEETELDKTLIEAIGDPLTHLVRNSIDHGFETPDERRAAGKSEQGTLSLHSYYDGGSVIIEVADDGRGLNRDGILKKARLQGLIPDDDQTPSDEAIDALIFHPGFSTATQVTDLSGRGVGMDIVKQAIQSLNGSINLTSSPGQGTRTRIRLPLTMAILEGLSLSIGNEVFILPLTSIVESIRPKPGDLTIVAGRDEVVRVRDEVLPILRLYTVFGSKPNVTDPCEGVLVIVENEGRKVAILADELIGQSQVVIKSMEANYRRVPCIAGATILGDGRVALIADVAELVRFQVNGAACVAV